MKAKLMFMALFVTLTALTFVPSASFAQTTTTGTVEGTVTDPHKTVLLEDPLHAVVVGQGRAAHGCETHGVEDVIYKESHGLRSVAPTAKVSGSDLYA